MTPFPLLVAKWAKVIVLAALAAAIITLIMTPRLPQYQDVSLDLSIPVPSRTPTSSYDYDGYYALQATDLFSNTLAGWFHSPDFVTKIYSQSGVSIASTSLRNLEKVFVVKKVSGQLVNVSFTAPSFDEANKLGTSIARNIAERVALINAGGNHVLEFSVVAGKPVVVQHQRDKYAAAGIAALIVIVFGFNLIIVVDALNRK